MKQDDTKPADLLSKPAVANAIRDQKDLEEKMKVFCEDNGLVGMTLFGFGSTLDLDGGKKAGAMVFLSTITSPDLDILPRMMLANAKPVLMSMMRQITEQLGGGVVPIQETSQAVGGKHDA